MPPFCQGRVQPCVSLDKRNGGFMSRIKKIISSISLALILSVIISIVAFASVGGGTTKRVSFTGQTVDSITFNGVTVEAKYALGGGYGSSQYSCAALVMKFYKAVYGFDVWNLSSSYAVPVCSNGERFIKTNAPRVGDIVRFQDRTHWALVKSVKGNTVTIIEQNWGYYSGGGYVAAVNRTVKLGDSQVSYFTYSAYDDGSGKPLEEAEFDSWEEAVEAANPEKEQKYSIETEDNLFLVAAGGQIENALTNNIG